MNFEEDIFKRYKLNTDKIDRNIFEKFFLDGKFKAVIKISEEGKVYGEVFDIENNDIYLPLRTESQNGEFCTKIRECYKNILKEIRDEYFLKEYFIFEQSNRIADLISKEFFAEPEFLWEKFSGCGVFRNPKTKKWFGIIMDIDKSKIIKNKKGLIEVLNIKLNPDEIKEKLKEKGFYSAYHMNKKNWLSIILNDEINDSEIMKLVEKSYLLS